MKTLLTVVLALGLATSAAAFPACWRLQPFDDVLQLSVQEVTDFDDVRYRFDVYWIGMPLYQLLGAGVARVDLNNPEQWHVSSSLVHGTAFFSGNPACDLTAFMSVHTGEGPWKIRCTGGTAPSMIERPDAIMVPVSCDGPVDPLMSTTDAAPDRVPQLAGMNSAIRR